MVVVFAGIVGMVMVVFAGTVGMVMVVLAVVRSVGMVMVVLAGAIGEAGSGATLFADLDHLKLRLLVHPDPSLLRMLISKK
ncbi:MAG: hypothetical protein IIU18_02265 [Oscillospiraceae bacterium]|nr:hypothetical protein [Oscillospiraceae bacterium]